jgi:hypothetical protein
MPALKYWDAGSNQYVLLMPGTPTTFPLIYTQTITAPTVVSSPYQVNHNLGTTTPLVQVYDAVTGQLVMVGITVANSNSIQVSVSANMPNNINVVVVGTAQSPIPINPADQASKSYVDARTPNLPAPITSGSGVQSFTDVLGDVWVALNGVAGGNWRRARDVVRARAYRNAAYTVPTINTFVGMPFDSTNDDGLSGWSALNTTSAVYTCPIAGRYLVMSRCDVIGTSVAARLLSTLVRGATLAGVVESVRGGDITTNSNTPMSSVCSGTMFCNALDVVQMRFYASVAQAFEVGTAMAWMDVQYIGTS